MVYGGLTALTAEQGEKKPRGTRKKSQVQNSVPFGPSRDWIPKTPEKKISQGEQSNVGISVWSEILTVVSLIPSSLAGGRVAVAVQIS